MLDLNTDHVFSVEAMVRGYHESVNSEVDSVLAFGMHDTLLYEREVSNVHIERLGCMVLKSHKHPSTSSLALARSLRPVSIRPTISYLPTCVGIRCYFLT